MICVLNNFTQIWPFIKEIHSISFNLQLIIYFLKIMIETQFYLCNKHKETCLRDNFQREQIKNIYISKIFKMAVEETRLAPPN